MEKQALEALLHKFNSGTATEEEKAIVESWYNLLPYDAEAPEHQGILEAKLQDWEQIAGRTAPVRRRLWPRVAVAAAAVAVIVFGVWFMTSESGALKQVQGDVAYKNDIAPGKQGATLTLANGKKIRLTDAVNGELAQEAGVTITKTANGQLLYVISSERSDERSLDPATSTDPSKVGMTNVLSTANGETYQVRLPDGTLVYLNSASSLKYPASFAKLAKRKVVLTGEGYFQVSKDKAHPFIVESRGQEVEVLGTEFNINSYSDEPAVATTLVEGSVSISSLRSSSSLRGRTEASRSNLSGRGPSTEPGSPSRNAPRNDVLLKPGEQALNKGTGITVSKVNIDNVTDWKSGDFYLNKVPFKEAMRKIARWYDVEVVYADDLPADIESNGYLSRDTKLSVVLKAIEKSGQVHFRVENRKIYITK